MKISLNFCLFIFTLISFSGLAQNKTELIDSLMTTSHERGVFNGNILVMKGNEVLYRNELGRFDAEGTVKLSADTKFNLGSISKSFSAVGLMVLVEDQKLSLDDSISKYVHGLPEWSHNIQIKNLLDYTSGLPREDDEISGDEEAWSVLMDLKELEAAPGTKFIYSNFNIFLRKRIIEKVAGLTYSHFLKTTFFEPLEMRSAVIDGIPGSSGIALAFDNHFVQDTYEPFLSDQVSSNIDDLQKWVSALHSGKIISKRSVFRLFQSFENNQSALGTGVFENDELMIHWDSGSSYNFQSSLCYFPKDQNMILLMTNNKNMNVGDLTTAVNAILRGKEFKLPKRSLYLTIRTEAFHNGFEDALALYGELKDDHTYDVSRDEKVLLKTAEYLLRKKKSRDALGVLNYAVKEFPNSENAKTALKKAEGI